MKTLKVLAIGALCTALAASVALAGANCTKSSSSSAQAAGTGCGGSAATVKTASTGAESGSGCGAHATTAAVTTTAATAAGTGCAKSAAMTAAGTGCAKDAAMKTAGAGCAHSAAMTAGMGCHSEKASKVAAADIQMEAVKMPSGVMAVLYTGKTDEAKALLAEAAKAGCASRFACPITREMASNEHCKVEIGATSTGVMVLVTADSDQVRDEYAKKFEVAMTDAVTAEKGE